MADDRALRDLLGRALSWQDAHADFDKAVEGIPPDQRGRRPSGLPYSPWQIVEHIRLAQEDILEFCRNPHYEERRWPDDYWPESPEPPSAESWDASIAAYRKDRADLEALAADSKLDLAARIPHGSGQTYQRELVLVIDHTAYHVGELIVLRRLLGIWGKQ